MAEPQIKIVYSVDIDGTETLEWQEGATVLSTTLTAGRYWAHNDTTLTDYPSLYDAVADAMTAESLASGSGYTYALSAITPTSSTQQENRGIRIRETGGNAWTWRPSAGTINALRVLGWPQSGANVASTSGNVDSIYTYAGAWWGVEPATRWVSYPARIVTRSTEIVERSDAYWLSRGTRRLRDLEWVFIEAAHVLTVRAEQAPYYTNGQLASSDSGNAFERLWDQASKGHEIIMVWYADPTSLDLDVTGWPYEVARMSDLDQQRSFTECVDVMRTGGELYKITLNTSRISGTWDTATS